MNARHAEKQIIVADPGLKWCAVQTKPKLEAQVEQRLKEVGLQVFLPWVRVKRRVGTRRQWVLEPLFPGYVFCRLDLIEAGNLARCLPGVKDFVRFGSRIPGVHDAAMECLLARCPEGIADVADGDQAGQAVLLKEKEGPLAGLDAVFVREMKGKERIAILLEFLGRQVERVPPRETVEA